MKHNFKLWERERERAHKYCNYAKYIWILY